MKAEQFIANLKTLNPPIEVEKFEDAEVFNDELVNLAMNYDISEVDFGDIGFAQEVLGDESTLEVGMFEEKFIIIDRETGVVRIEDDDEEGTIIYTCADSGEKFIEALWIAVQYFSKQLNEGLTDQHLDESEAIAQKCAEAAGSEDYFPFYQDFLNCYEN